MINHDELAARIFDELSAVMGSLYSKVLDRNLDVKDVLDAVHIATDDEEEN